MSSSEIATLMGIVVPAVWNAKNEVTDVLIAVKGEKEYIVTNSSDFPILLRCCGARVEIAGFVTEAEGFEGSVQIVSYILLDPLT